MAQRGYDICQTAHPLRSVGQKALWIRGLRKPTFPQGTADSKGPCDAITMPMSFGSREMVVRELFSILKKKKKTAL